MASSAVSAPPDRRPADGRGVESTLPQEGIMATRIRSEHLEPRTSDTLDYYAAEGIPRPEPEQERARREWTMVAAGLAGLIALLAVVLGAFALAKSGSGETTTVFKQPTTKPAAAAPAEAPTLAAAKGIKFEPFEKVDPTLPAVPAGAGKKFTVGLL